MTRAIMIQGAGSNVGKSMLVAGLCRAYRARGLKVAPFKPQNMSNNAAVTVDGGEIGRAQALQARACGLAPHSDMNPVLLKPETETGAQVIVQGRRLTSLKARDYGALKPTLMPRVLESFHRLAAGADLVIVEGAGSPAEVNLRRGDIANMGFAEAAGVNVILVGDIDRGGVIAQLVGSHAVLEPADRDRIKGFMVNKFRGEPALFAEGAATIARATGWADMGLIPWFSDAWRLPAEDVLDLGRAPRRDGAIKVAVLQLSRIANFDDLDPLAAQEGVDLTILRPGQALPGDIDLVILPGSKSTIGDLADLRSFGWDIDLMAHHRRGGRILGICGGYQMLGRRISDPDGVEGPPSSVPGLGFLDVETVMLPQKRLAEVTGQSQGGHAVTGYEIHMGETHGPDCARPMMQLFDSETGLADHGAQSRDGRVGGCYLHGLFASDGFRAAYLGLGDRPATDMGFEDSVEATLDALADHMAQHVDLDHLLTLADEI